MGVIKVEFRDFDDLMNQLLDIDDDSVAFDHLENDLYHRVGGQGWVEIDTKSWTIVNVESDHPDGSVD